VRVPVALAAVILVSALFSPALGSSESLERVIEKAHDHYFNLEYDESIAAYREAISLDPDNPRFYNQLASATLYKELHRLGLLETSAFKNDELLERSRPEVDRDVRQSVIDALKRSRDLAEKQLKAEPHDPTARFALAVGYGLQANYQFMLDKAYFTALRSGQTAKKQANRLLKDNPEFVDGLLIVGAQEYVIGSLPWAARALVALGGVSGSKTKGEQMVVRVSRGGRWARYEARVLLALLYRRERRPLEAASQLEALIEAFPRNYVLRLELGSMYVDADEKQRALETLRTARRMTRRNEHRYGRMPERLREALDRKIAELERTSAIAPAAAVD